MLTPQAKNLLALFPLALTPALLLPMTRWLQHQHSRHVFVGLGSSFWAGVLLGISIACGLLTVSFVVLLVLRSSHLSQDDSPTQG